MASVIVALEARLVGYNSTCDSDKTLMTHIDSRLTGSEADRSFDHRLVRAGGGEVSVALTWSNAV